MFVFHFRSISEALVPLSMLGGICVGGADAMLAIGRAGRFDWLAGLLLVGASFVGAFLLFNVSPDEWVFREGVREWDSMRAWAWFACGTMLSASVIGLRQAISWRRGGRYDGGTHFPYSTGDDGGDGPGDIGG